MEIGGVGRWGTFQGLGAPGGVGVPAQLFSPARLRLGAGLCVLDSCGLSTVAAVTAALTLMKSRLRITFFSAVALNSVIRLFSSIRLPLAWFENINFKAN
jgi:hypothetical protein